MKLRILFTLLTPVALAQDGLSQACQDLLAEHHHRHHHHDHNPDATPAS